MGKMLVLSFVILLAIGSAVAYLLLTGMITAGEAKVASGKRQIEEGQPALETGREKLDAGKRQLSEGKEKYKKARHNVFLVIADRLFHGGKGFKDARKQIAEGESQVANGDVAVAAGEKRLDEGKLKLIRGTDQLGLAKIARFACALGAPFFAALSVVLWFRWRRKRGLAAKD